MGNQAIGGAGQSGVNSGAGGTAEGGAIYHKSAYPLNISSNTDFEGNLAKGGPGAPSSSGGGAGGNAYGGGIDDEGSGFDLIVATFEDNTAKGGAGGNCTGNSGNGGAVARLMAEPFATRVSSPSAIAPLLGPANVRWQLGSWRAAGGSGGVPTGLGGPGGGGLGGAVENEGAMQLSLDTFGVPPVVEQPSYGNESSGGEGGSATGYAIPGAGGAAQGGAVFNGISPTASLTVAQCDFDDNQASAGDGGSSATGKNGGVGGNGGKADGGGVANAHALSITASTFENNRAFGGTGGMSTNSVGVNSRAPAAALTAGASKTRGHSSSVAP